MNRGEKRVYVIVAGTVQVPSGTGTRTVIQPPGRQIAQACHAVGLFRYRQAYVHPPVLYEDLTTIILQARDSAELQHVAVLLAKKKIIVHIFQDDNPDYGREVRVATAFCTEPIYKDQIKDVADYLPLWGPK